MEKQIRKFVEKQMKHKWFQRLISKTVTKQLLILNPGNKQALLIKEYYGNKFTKIIIMTGILVVLFSLIGVAGAVQSELSQGKFLNRNQYGEGQKEIELEAKIGETNQKINVSVSERQYSEDEINQMFDEIEVAMNSEILGKNVSVDEVRSKLNLFSLYQEFPVYIEWESDQYDLVDSQGNIMNEDLKEPKVVILTATIHYNQMQRIIERGLLICPPKRSYLEEVKAQLLSAISREDHKQIEKEVLHLPEEIELEQSGEEVEIEYQEVKSNQWLNYLFGTILIIGLVYWGYDKDLDNKCEQRQKNLKYEYPEFITTFSLLVSSGMSLKNAFVNMLIRYNEGKKMGNQKKEVYEEVQLLIYELDNHVLEDKAYENFGKRCKVSYYVKFAGILSQNMKKGSSEFIQTLENEVRESFDIRKSLAKQLGEEAGTKLLLPMILMLLVVMVLILLPAFIKFQI